MIKSQVRRILDIVADLSQNDIKKDVLETEIISHSELPAVEVRNHLNELEWLNLVKEFHHCQDQATQSLDYGM